ncbi:MAG: MerR family transcriptional regulator [Bacteroidales bacterium]|jgi:DNA-binding transcriptional MerR regulator
MLFLEKDTDKIYFTIGEVADMFKVNTSLIRFWEKEFTLIKPQKNKKGDRLFTKKDINNFQVIYHLVKEKGFTIEGAKKKLKENPDDTLKNAEVINRLKKIREFLIEVEKGFERGAES